MVEKRIAFVLGAGASIPYGYPSGAQLVNRMLESPTESISNVLRELQLLDQLVAFQQALRMSQTSIDSFLERRSDFGVLGKVMIAAHILRCEDEAPFFNPLTKDHWYPCC